MAQCPLNVLTVVRKPEQTTAEYAASHPHKNHEGNIDLLTEAAGGLPERLLSPVLFP